MRNKEGLYRKRNYLMKTTEEEFDYLRIKAKKKCKSTIARFIRDRVFPANWKTEYFKLKREYGVSQNGG